jgi:DNA recombination protein RmuC
MANFQTYYQMYYPHAIAFLAGLLLMFLIMRVRIGRAEARREAVDQQLRTANNDAASLRTQAEHWRSRCEQAMTQAGSLEAELRTRKEDQEEEIQHITQIRTQIETELKALSVKALSDNQAQFQNFANQLMDSDRQKAVSEMETRRAAVDSLIEPLRDSLDRYERGLREMEQARRAEHGNLTNELKKVVSGQLEVRSEASKLARALSRTPGAPGRWGERTVERVLELAGLVKGIDFDLPGQGEADDGLLRPDVLVRLQGGKSLVIDAKTPLGAYLDALGAQDEAGRAAKLAEHARVVRTHMSQLAAKEYWDRLADSPDLVVMFLPNDGVLSGALESDPALFDDAMRARVMVATPATLVTLVKAVAYGWRQEQITRNAKEIEKLGRDLFDRMSAMLGHVADLGQHVDGATSAYNRFVRSLETQVLSQGRRFAELRIGNPDRSWAYLPTIEATSVPPKSLAGEGEAQAPGA